MDPCSQASYDTGVAGLAWSVRRRQRGHETLTQFALSMRLIVAKALRRLRRLDEAEYAFKVLAGARHGSCCMFSFKLLTLRNK